MNTMIPTRRIIMLYLQQTDAPDYFHRRFIGKTKTYFRKLIKQIGQQGQWFPRNFKIDLPQKNIIFGYRTNNHSHYIYLILMEVEHESTRTKINQLTPRQEQESSRKTRLTTQNGQGWTATKMNEEIWLAYWSYTRAYKHSSTGKNMKELFE